MRKCRIAYGGDQNKMFNRLLDRSSFTLVDSQARPLIHQPTNTSRPSAVQQLSTPVISFLDALPAPPKPKRHRRAPPKPKRH